MSKLTVNPILLNSIQRDEEVPFKEKRCAMSLNSVDYGYRRYLLKITLVVP